MRCGLVLGVCVTVVRWALSVRGQDCASVLPCLNYSYVPCSTSGQILINSSNTTSTGQQFDQLDHADLRSLTFDHTTLNYIAQTCIAGWILDPVHVILKSPETAGWQSVFFESILALLCVEYSPGNSSNETTPYCWTAVTSTIAPDSCNLTCNCTAIDLWVLEAQSHNVVSPLRVAAVLNKDSSKVALHFAGFTQLNASAEEETGNPVGVNLFDVPLLSWICVGLGIIVSLLVVSTPAWWDRLIIGVCMKSCKKSDGGSPELRLQTINQLDPITEET